MADKTKNKDTGNLGEEIATRYLEGKGYKIIGRNIKFSVGEIDILAKIKEKIVIVEVKTVQGKGFGSAQDLVRFAKQNKLRLLAGVISQKYPSKSLRIDVVGIDLSSTEEPRVEHIENAVEG